MTEMRRMKTVGELIAALQEYHPDTLVVSYDTIGCPCHVGVKHPAWAPGDYKREELVAVLPMRGPLGA
jgi:hypothetical protein